MSARRKRRKFRLVEVSAFDARRGYRRCTPTGVGITYGRRLEATADFWTSRDGKLVTRISSRGYVFHFEALRVNGKKISVDEMTEFGDYVADTLFEWVAEGVDEIPNSFFDF